MINALTQETCCCLNYSDYSILSSSNQYFTPHNCSNFHSISPSELFIHNFSKANWLSLSGLRLPVDSCLLCSVACFKLELLRFDLLKKKVLEPSFLVESFPSCQKRNLSWHMLGWCLSEKLHFWTKRASIGPATFYFYPTTQNYSYFSSVS